MNFDGLYTVRKAVASDRNFVLKSFLLGIYYGDSWFSRIPKRIFMDNYKQVATTLFDNPYNVVTIACLSDDPDTIIGYSIVSADASTIHWVYIKEKWRNYGIAKRLLPSTPQYVTHLTQLGFQLLKKFPDTILFNPFKS